MRTSRKTWIRGAVTLGILGAFAAAMIVSPAGAHVTRKLKHLYKHLDPRYVNVGETVANATNADKLDNLDSSAFQQKCTDGAVLAYALVDGNGAATSNTTFSTNGVTQSFNCKGGPIEVRWNGTGDYSLRIPGVTTVNPTTGVYLFQSADDHNDGIVNIDTHASDDYIEVDTFNASDGVDDDADFYLIALRAGT
jgi:hypothetical protein